MIDATLVGEKIFNILKGQGFMVKSYDREGNLTLDASEATRFAVPEPNILVRYDQDTQTVQLKTSSDVDDEVTRTMLKNLASDNLLNFDYRRFEKKVSPKGEQNDIAASKEQEVNDVMEGFGTMTGTSKSSYQTLENVKIAVKHSKPVNEESRGARSRNIESIHIRRGGESFKMNENNLRAARAMARHIQEGGEMHDSVGNAIQQMATEHRELREFVGYVRRNSLVSESNVNYVDMAVTNVSQIRETFDRLARAKTYASESENIVNRSQSEMLGEEEEFRSAFTETHYDDRVSAAMESIHRAMGRQAAYESHIESAVANESFSNLKHMVSEGDLIEYETPQAQLGSYVNQLSQCCEDKQLGSFLKTCGSKISEETELNVFEMNTVRGCLSQAQGIKESVKAYDHGRAYVDFIANMAVLPA
jgi:hypothetical protein